MVPAPKRGELVRLIGQALREKKDQLGTSSRSKLEKLKPKAMGKCRK